MSNVALKSDRTRSESSVLLVHSHGNVALNFHQSIFRSQWKARYDDWLTVNSCAVTACLTTLATEFRLLTGLKFLNIKSSGITSALFQQSGTCP